MEQNERKPKGEESGILARYAKPLGALIVTGLILYFLFGIPAYILFSNI